MDPIPLSGVQTIHPNNEVNSVPPAEYSEAMKNYIMHKRRRMIAARDARDVPRDETDNMPFLKWYDIQKKADDQYIAPRKNKTDTEINTGTIRDKDTTLVEYAMKYDFEPVAQVFDDEDEMLEELAETAEDMVRKSKLIEEYKQKAKLIYRSMVTFGTALVEDGWFERWVIEKNIGKSFKMGSLDSTWVERKIKQADGCQAKLWDLRKCYFGDIRKFFMNGPQGQPYFFTVEYESYDVTKKFFEDWDNWKSVSTTVVISPEMTAANTFSSYWTLRPITLNYCEIIRYYDPIENEFSLTINGTEMLPIMEKKIRQEGGVKTLISGFPLTAVSPSGAIPFAKFDLEPMHESAYSKSQPAKMRVWGDVENMIVKLLLRMMKQKSDPTLGNKSGKNFHREEATTPGTIINDIREGDLFPILPNFKGPEPADFSMFEMVKKELDKNSVDRSFQGTDNQPQNETATQDMNDMKAQSLKVASMFDGICYGEAQLNWLRTYNISKNWTKPIEVKVDSFNKALVNKYRTVTMSTSIDGGQKGTKKIIFTKDTHKKSSEDLHMEEIGWDDKRGMATKPESGNRIILLHPEQYAQMKFSWFYTTVPVPNGSDPLSYILFAKQINDATTFFGPDSLNVKKLKHRFAALTGNDFDTWFISQQELDQKQQMQQQQQMQNPVGSPQTVPGKPINGNPTIAGAAQGANPAASLGSIMK